MVTWSMQTLKLTHHFQLQEQLYKHCCLLSVCRHFLKFVDETFTEARLVPGTRSVGFKEMVKWDRGPRPNPKLPTQLPQHLFKNHTMQLLHKWKRVSARATLLAQSMASEAGEIDFNSYLIQYWAGLILAGSHFAVVA